MKIIKNLIVFVVIFFLGWTMAIICANSDSNNFKRELIEAQYDTLIIADSLLISNKIYNSEYIKAYEKVDSLYLETL